MGINSANLNPNIIPYSYKPGIKRENEELAKRDSDISKFLDKAGISKDKLSEFEWVTQNSKDPDRGTIQVQKQALRIKGEISTDGGAPQNKYARMLYSNFDTYAKGKDHLTVDDLYAFITDSKGGEVDPSEKGKVSAQKEDLIKSGEDAVNRAKQNPDGYAGGTKSGSEQITELKKGGYW
jgi:hypothetical protein